LVSYNGTKYKCTVANTAIAGWDPVDATTLYSLVGPCAPTATPTPPPAVPPSGKYAHVGYFPEWGIYGRAFFINSIVTSGQAPSLTHLNYAFGNIDGTNGICLQGVVQATGSDPEGTTQGVGAGDAYADYGDPMSAANSVDGVADSAGGQALAGNFNQLKKLRAKYPTMNILISLGGWTYSHFWSDVAATDASRKKFVASCISTYIQGNLPVYSGYGGPGSAAGIFTGIDIDWEWPGGNLGHPGNDYSTNDKANLILLLKEFRTELDALNNGHYLLTAFGPADPTKLAAGWDLTQLFNYIDFLDVQGYDFHGAGSDNSWEPTVTGNQAQIYAVSTDPHGTTDFSDDSAIKMYTSAGINPRLLTIGVPYYGRGWEGVVPGTYNDGEWATATGASNGQFGASTDVNNAGTWNSYPPSPQTPLLTGTPSCTISHDTAAVSSFCYTGGPAGVWWSFDDAWAIGQKASYIKTNNLLGVMIWDVSGDNGTLTNALTGGGI
jgi:chitinase